MTVVPGLNHFGIFNTPAAWETIAAWLRPCRLRQPPNSAGRTLQIRV